MTQAAQQSRRALAWIACLALSCLCGCQTASGAPSQSESEPLVVFAAMSLKAPVTEVAERYESRTGTKVVLHFAGSNLLARQIEASRKQDVYFSANTDWMQHLVDGGVARKSDVVSLLSNRLVAVARPDAPFEVESMQDLLRPEVQRIALGDPRGVPVGRYAKTALQHAGLWDQVQGKLSPGSNVRIALQAAAADPGVVAFVYRTDAALEPKVKTLFELPSEATGKIEYVVAPVARSQGAPRPAAREFVAFLGSKDASRAFSNYGFIVP